MLSILKVRGNGVDPALRESHISGDGIDLRHTFENTSAILTSHGSDAGVGSPPPGPPAQAAKPGKALRSPAPRKGRSKA